MSSDEYLEQLLSKAEHHSSGTFTCDLKRMQDVLRRYQLASADEYVLALLSGAVLSGASWFRLEDRGGATQISWDGPALTTTQLSQLVPSLTQTGTAQGELAVGLLAAHRLGEVRLQSAHAMLRFQDKLAVVDEPGHEGDLRLTLRRKWWWNRWLGSRASANILRNRGRFAPLQLTPSTPPPPVATPLVVSFGQLRPNWLKAGEWVDLPPSPFGTGLLYVERAAWQVIRLGVTYALPGSIDGLTALWWSDQFPLDLTRKKLVSGVELEGWMNWLQVQFSERNLLERFAPLIKAWDDMNSTHEEVLI